MRKRVLLAGMVHETHTFLRGVTGVEDFLVRTGDTLLGAAGDGSPLDGMLQVAREAAWELLPVIDMRAMPSGMVGDAVVDLFWTAFAEAAAREVPQGVDGICLSLHGAMVSETIPDVEGEVLRRIRAVPGLEDVPICGVLDLHGNITAAMARYSTGLVSYRENPHTDARAAAVDGARLLDRLLRTGERPVTVWEQPPIVWPPTGTGTAVAPMRSLEAAARAIEAAHPEILAVNVFAGFSFADLAETGVSFTAITLGDPEVARAHLRRLSAIALAERELGNVLGMRLEAAMERLAAHDHGPVILIESADNIGAGAPGDLTPVLGALLAHGVQNGAVVITDPAAVKRLEGMHAGSRLRTRIGGWSGEIGAAPLELEVEVRSRSDGRFSLEDRQSHLAALTGINVAMGPSVVVQAGGVRILLTSEKMPPMDLAQLRSQGIEPESLYAIGVKAAVAHRRAYDPIAAASYLLDTPGPCANDLRLLPYRRIRRPIYPLDDL